MVIYLDVGLAMLSTVLVAIPPSDPQWRGVTPSGVVIRSGLVVLLWPLFLAVLVNTVMRGRP